MIRIIGLLLCVLSGSLQAQTADSLVLLQERLIRVDAAAGDEAAVERLQARQAVQAVPMARARDRAFAIEIATLRVATAEAAWSLAQLRRQSSTLDRERDAIFLEASRRDAELARKEAERLRLQALAREEEETFLVANEPDIVAETGATGNELADKDGALARIEEELAALAISRGDALLRLGSGGARYRLAGTAFQPGKAVLQAEARQLLSQLGKRLKASGQAWSIEGFSDNLGSEAASLAWSRQRAEAVAAVLKAAGVPAGKLHVKAWGAAKPLASNAGKTGRAQNRRVEISQK